MRKSFGPASNYAPSRGESYATGHEDSFHSQDTHRSGLPISMMMGGGAAAAGVGVGGQIFARSVTPSAHGGSGDHSLHGANGAAAMMIMPRSTSHGSVTVRN